MDLLCHQKFVWEPNTEISFEWTSCTSTIKTWWWKNWDSFLLLDILFVFDFFYRKEYKINFGVCECKLRHIITKGYVYVTQLQTCCWVKLLGPVSMRWYVQLLLFSHICLLPFTCVSGKFAIIMWVGCIKIRIANKWDHLWLT